MCSSRPCYYLQLLASGSNASSGDEACTGDCAEKPSVEASSPAVGFTSIGGEKRVRAGGWGLPDPARLARTCLSIYVCNYLYV